MSENSTISGVATSADAGQSNEAIARVERSAALATLAISREEERSERENDEKHVFDSASVVASSDMLTLVKLMVGGLVFEVEKSALLRFGNTFFHGLFSSGAWQPDVDGAYFIDRPAVGFDRIFEYLRSGKLSVEGLSELEENCMYSSLDYLLIPYRRQWKYDTESLIEGFSAQCVLELKDGRLIGANGEDIVVWNMESTAIDMTMEGHTKYIGHVIELHDRRVCSRSEDSTIKIWSLDSGLCELTLSGHTHWVVSIVQLIDGRVCSGSWDSTIRVWNVSTGVCEMVLVTRITPRCIVQLVDGRICCGGNCIIYIYSLLTGQCEQKWAGHTYENEFGLTMHWVKEIIRIDATRICSGPGDTIIKVWNAASGECERTLEGHTSEVTSIVLMQDGRLCSGSDDGTLKLWNLDTGECEKTLMCTLTAGRIEQVLQLNDGRLAVTTNNPPENNTLNTQVWLWS